MLQFSFMFYMMEKPTKLICTSKKFQLWGPGCSYNVNTVMLPALIPSNVT